VLQCVAVIVVCTGDATYVALLNDLLLCVSLWQCVAACCSVLQCVAVIVVGTGDASYVSLLNALQVCVCVAVWCNALQCIAVCCSVLQ